MNKIFCLVT